MKRLFTDTELEDLKTTGEALISVSRGGSFEFKVKDHGPAIWRRLPDMDIWEYLKEGFILRPYYNIIMSTLPSIKYLVKDNFVFLERYKSGNLFYRLSIFDDRVSKHYNVHRLFEFPVPVSDVGEAEMKNKDKAILFMSYIRKAIEEKTFIEL